MLRRFTGISLIVGAMAAFTVGSIELLTATEFTSGTALAVLAVIMGAPMFLFAVARLD